MAGEGFCLIDCGSTSASAAAWVMAFYPDVTVRIDAGKAFLASAERDDSALRQIWAASLVNEQLLVRGAARRSALLEELTR